MDCSVAAKVLWEEPDSALAEALFERVPGGLIASDLLRMEIANAIRFSRSLPSREAREEALAAFEGLGIDLRPSSSADIAEALRLALATDATVYDALYLAMARRLGGRLITADKKFAARAKSSDMVLLDSWKADA